MDWVHAPGAARLDGLELSDEETRHLVRVRRAREGDVVCGTDGEGTVFSARVRSLRPRATLEILSRQTPAFPWASRLVLGLAPAKGEAMTAALAAAAALGATDIVPVETERAVARVTANARERFARALVEAGKQANRPRFPALHAPCALPAFLGTWAEVPVRRILHPGLFPALGPAGEDAVVLVGPEGGFADDEVAAARAAGFAPASLGPYLLRSELAAATAVARLRAGTGG